MLDAKFMKEYCQYDMILKFAHFDGSLTFLLAADTNRRPSPSIPPRLAAALGLPVHHPALGTVLHCTVL